MRCLALRAQMWAPLAPKPLSDQVGNGAHLYLSLWSNFQNLFADEGEVRSRLR